MLCVITMLSSSMLYIISTTDEDPSLRIESSAIINLRGVSTKLNKYNLQPFAQTTMTNCKHYMHHADDL